MKKILVIDDHPAVMEGTKTILETDTNLSVDCLSPDASEQFVLRHDFSAYDLILMDLNLGDDISGIELSKKILKRILSAKSLSTQAMRLKIILKNPSARACMAPSAKPNLKRKSCNTYIMC